MMTKNKPIRDEDLARAAEEMVDRALAPYESLISADEMALMRFLMETDLLADPESREDLRRAIDDPKLTESGDVETADSAEEGECGEGTA